MIRYFHRGILQVRSSKCVGHHSIPLAQVICVGCVCPSVASFWLRPKRTAMPMVSGLLLSRHPTGSCGLDLCLDQGNPNDVNKHAVTRLSACAFYSMSFSLYLSPTDTPFGAHIAASRAEIPPPFVLGIWQAEPIANTSRQPTSSPRARGLPFDIDPQENAFLQTSQPKAGAKKLEVPRFFLFYNIYFS